MPESNGWFIFWMAVDILAWIALFLLFFWFLFGGIVKDSIKEWWRNKHLPSKQCEPFEIVVSGGTDDIREGDTLIFQGKRLKVCKVQNQTTLSVRMIQNEN